MAAIMTRITPFPVRESRCLSLIFCLARAVPPMMIGIIQKISMNVGDSPNQSQLRRNTKMTPPMLLRAFFIPIGKNFTAQRLSPKLTDPVNPAKIRLGVNAGSCEKLLGLANNRSGDMEIISDKFLAVATERPSCLRT